ncbi:MAG TPA: hypothetical protein VFO28_02560, partial [Burkholderiaceae bacterium]|nr:hypothetical protein [Burkholderiaceae bacterium]
STGRPSAASAAAERVKARRRIVERFLSSSRVSARDYLGSARCAQRQAQRVTGVAPERVNLGHGVPIVPVHLHFLQHK